MKLKIVFATLGIISLRDFLAVVHAKSVNISAISENNFNLCGAEESCLDGENLVESRQKVLTKVHSRKRKGSGGNSGNNVVVLGEGGGGGGHHTGYGLGDYYVEEDYGHSKGKRGRKKVWL
jgi:hypothetical protein